jgi:phage FluMu protein Com
MEANEKYKTTLDEPNSHEVRCECGSLVAKLVGSAIELKCRRCKRLALIPLAQFKGGSQTVTVRL